MKSLVKNSGGRWCVAETEFQCGSPIVAYITNQGWLNGRVEYSDNKGYYFLNEEKNIRVPLSEDLEVRTEEEQDFLAMQAAVSDKFRKEGEQRLEDFKQGVAFVENHGNWFALFPQTFSRMIELKYMLHRCMWEDGTLHECQYDEYSQHIENLKREMLREQYMWLISRLNDRQLTTEQLVSSIFDVVFGNSVKELLDELKREQEKQINKKQIVR